MAVAKAMAKVLVIDDDADVRAILRLALEDEGYQVLEAADGAQALELLRTAAQPLVVLVDLVLREMAVGSEGAGHGAGSGSRDGALLRAVRAEAGLRRHAYVALTGLPTAAFSPALRDAVSTVCMAVVSKPFELDGLLAVVRRAAEHVGTSWTGPGPAQPSPSSPGERPS